MIIPNDIQDVMQELAGDLFSAKNPRTGKPIQFRLNNNNHQYLYFRANGNDYCYTPHADTNGWYYSFAYIGKGAGSRIGRAKQWTMKKLTPHRARKAAKARAIKLWEQAK